MRNTYAILVWYNGPNKISAVKTYRAMTGVGLKEAKEAIENPAGIILTIGLLKAFKCYYRDQIYKNTDFPNTGQWVRETGTRPANPLGLSWE